MRKRNIILTVMIATVLSTFGCGKASTEVTGTEVMEQLSNEEPLSPQSEETSVFAGEEAETYTQESEMFGESVEEVSEMEIVVEGSEGTIRIGTTGTPYTELLTQAKIQLAKKGWDLQIEVYTDYTQMNQDVLEKKLDAHLFAHQTYVDSYNDVNGTDLVGVSNVCYEKYGIYSKLNEELTNNIEGVVFAIPEDETRKAKALLFLHDMGYITLKENVGLTAIEDDVIENPKNLQFVKYDLENITEIVKTADYCVMGANQAILAGFDPYREVIVEETLTSEHVSALAALLVTTEENTQSDKLGILIEELKSETIQKYVDDIYKGAIGLFF